MNKTLTPTVAEQVLTALDGRTQRWLSLRAQIPESELSRKMNGKIKFTKLEIDHINSVLGSQIKLKTGK